MRTWRKGKGGREHTLYWALMPLTKEMAQPPLTAAVLPLVSTATAVWGLSFRREAGAGEISMLLIFSLRAASLMMVEWSRYWRLRVLG